jgi:ABC-type dipeptide/oligopeptide/nickel transport system permease component
LQSIIVVWTVYTLTFVLLMMVPGDPFVGEKKPPQAVLDGLAKTYGLEYLAIPEEKRGTLSWAEHAGYIGKAYFRYLGNAATGNFGPSIDYPNFSVNDIIKSSLPVSATLGSMALLIALWGGSLLGMLTAVKKGSVSDAALSSVTLLGVSLPAFVVGALVLLAMSVYFPHAAAVGWGSWKLLILPAAVLSLFYLAYIARLARSSTLDVLSADFVRTARAKGLAPSRVILHHAGANAALPVLSYLGPAAANILVGSFVVEKLFVIPGLGAHFVNGCINKDIPLVLGVVMVYTLLVVFFNLLVDIAYAAVDPRISLR